MPRLSKHIEQYNHNKSLLQENIFNMNTSIYSDWIITIIFYCAIHLIEESLAHQNMHNNDHRERNQKISEYAYYKSIKTKYYTLYQLSIKARYECFRFDQNKLEGALNRLNDIESYIRN